jgi:hypothetical protein
VVRLRSGLWADGLIFLTHSGDPIGHWHRVTEQFARIYALPRLRIERRNNPLDRETIMMTVNRQPLVSYDVMSRTYIKSPALDELRVSCIASNCGLCQSWGSQRCAVAGGGA